MKMVLTFFCAVALISSAAFGQAVMITNFDDPNPATFYHINLESPSTITLTSVTDDKVEGAASMKLWTKLANVHSWGTYSEFGLEGDVGTPWNWSVSDSLSIWLKVTKAPGVPANVVMRIHITDQPTAGDATEDWIYENTTIIDAVSGWVNLRVPLFARPVDNSNPNETGFIPAPTSWNMTRNNEKFDMDKIVAWRIAVVTANTAPDSVEILFDKFERTGTRAFPVTIFNGIDFTGIVSGSAWAWGSSSISVEPNAGPLPKTNAIMWTQGSGWTGWGVDLNPVNMSGSWDKDSLKFKIKCESGVGALRVQLESATGKKGIVFQPTADNQWHSYVFALKDLVFQDNTTSIDSTAIIKFGLMAENSGVAGKVLYVTDIWTGNPTFDVIPPDSPTNVTAITSEPYTNLILWTDIDNTNEPNPRYNVYFSDKPWTSIDDPNVTDIPLFNLPQGTQLQTHLLRAPISDKQVTNYYGVVAKDEAGNNSLPALSGPVTNLAKGVPTISMTPPAFVADGDLSEWASITPFNLSVSGDAHVNENGTIDGDADLSAKAYYAIDNDYLYVAYDVTDDMVVVDTTVNSYENDSPDLYIGLYHWVGKTHTGIKSGATPDFHLRFAKNRALIDNNGQTVMYPGPNYAWQQKLIDAGYTVEAKMSLADLAAKLGGGAVTFVPQNGYRIAIDIVINDRDAKTVSDLRDGMLIYSPINTNDASWQDMWRWTYTWLGTGVMSAGENNGVVNKFELSQNYPNPFNPTTQIRFNLEKAGYTTLKVYDVLGRLVATLVDGYQEAGPRTITFNASRNIASGLYLYKLESGAFTAVKKMLLIK